MKLNRIQVFFLGKTEPTRSDIHKFLELPNPCVIKFILIFDCSSGYLKISTPILSPMIQLTINGQPRQFESPINVTQLIDHLALHGKRIAIERNGEIIPRSQFSEQILIHGDQLEVVVAVGGG